MKNLSLVKRNYKQQKNQKKIGKKCNNIDTCFE